MKKYFLTVLVTVIAFLSFGQTIKIQGGISSSSLDWAIVNQTLKIYDNRMIGYSFFLGIDYLPKKYFNLSSNIGVIKKGGSEEVLFTDLSGNYLYTKNQKATLDYLSFNTSIDLKLPIKEKVFPYLSIGPRIDYLISNNDIFSPLKNKDELNKLIYGINVGAGINYKISKYMLGIRGDYLVNLKNISDYIPNNGEPELNVKDNTFIVNLVFWLKIK